MTLNLIFDFDGTLADTSKLIVATMQKAIEDCGLPFRNEEQIKATIGVRLEEIPSILWPEMQGIAQPFADRYRKNFEILKNRIAIELFPGVKDTLADLKEKGYKLAIATSRSHRSVVDLAELLGIKEDFEYLLGGDNVENGKPDPESIFTILKEMDWKPEETMMVGDMAVDILMGKNAGIKTCAVTYGNGKSPQLKQAGADFIINDFRDLPEVLLSGKDR